MYFANGIPGVKYLRQKAWPKLTMIEMNSYYIDLSYRIYFGRPELLNMQISPYHFEDYFLWIR